MKNQFAEHQRAAVAASTQAPLLEQIADRLYSCENPVGINAIEVYIHRVRKKLEPAGIHIRTVRGLGYLLEH